MILVTCLPTSINIVKQTLPPSTSSPLYSLSIKPPHQHNLLKCRPSWWEVISFIFSHYKYLPRSAGCLVGCKHNYNTLSLVLPFTLALLSFSLTFQLHNAMLRLGTDGECKQTTLSDIFSSLKCHCVEIVVLLWVRLKIVQDACDDYLLTWNG